MFEHWLAMLSMLFTRVPISIIFLICLMFVNDTRIPFFIVVIYLELAAATMPVYLFNDLFAYTTIDISEQVFIVMEEKASIWRTVCDHMWTNRKQNYLSYSTNILQ
jgi:hypothetical protein